jgi:hypothetical protein
MKRIALVFVTLLAVLVFARTANAQVTISGVGMANYSTPLLINEYWSIYGSGLSSGPETAEVITNYWTLLNGTAIHWINEDNYLQGGSWYESYSQINFYSEGGAGYITSQCDVEVGNARYGSSQGFNVTYKYADGGLQH